LGKVSRYIEEQEEHHRKGKLSALLEMAEIQEDDWPERIGKPPEGGWEKFIGNANPGLKAWARGKKERKCSRRLTG
jgi:hypothetical protein